MWAGNTYIGLHSPYINGCAVNLASGTFGQCQTSLNNQTESVHSEDV